MAGSCAAAPRSLTPRGRQLSAGQVDLVRNACPTLLEPILSEQQDALASILAPLNVADTQRACHVWQLHATALIDNPPHHHHHVHKQNLELKLLPDATVDITWPDGRQQTSRPRGRPRGRPPTA